MEKGLMQKVAESVLGQAEHSANDHAANFCKYWIGVEQVPQALLEASVQNGEEELN